MRLALAVLCSMLLFGAAACGDDSEELQPTATAVASTASPTEASPTVASGACPLPAAQCAQAEQIREWLEAEDIDAIVAAAETTTYTCTAATGAGGPLPLCEGVAAGEQRTGIGIARRYSEGAALSIDDYHAALRAILDAVNPAASDAGGPGALELVAVSCVDPTQDPAACTRSVAIFSAIIRQTAIPGWGIGGGRELLLFWMSAASVETDTPVESTWTGIVQAPEVEILMSTGGTLFDLGRVFVLADRATDPSSTPAANPRHTGIAAVDDIIDAVTTGDIDALVEAAVIQDVACADLPASLCDQSSPGGTAPVLPGAICDANPVLDEGDAVRTALAGFASRVSSVEILAAWYVEPERYAPSLSVPSGSVRVLWDSGPSLVISSDGGIWYVYRGCGDGADALQLSQAEDFLIEPPK